MKTPLNIEVAEQLDQIADLLEQQGANPFRINAYRKAALTLNSLKESVQDIVADKGIDGLVALPTIGTGIAQTIYEIVATGRASRLQRLRGELDPVRLFQTVPGIGPGLAEQIHNELHIDTLEALESAAHNGRLEKVPGLGRRRVSAIRGALTELLGRRAGRGIITSGLEPSIRILLAVDKTYRDGAQSNRLTTIAPKRFNPKGESWLPILHTTRDNWHFTVLYSNTARAHDLGKTKDWVVIYFYDDHHHEAQHTVVTETKGPLQGNRVVRGREMDCRDYYAAASRVD